MFLIPGCSANCVGGCDSDSALCNVFLGLGLPYLISSIYAVSTGIKNCNPAGSLVFSVIVYTVLALLCLALLAYRRKALGAELGGPAASKYLHATVLVLMWVVYIVLSSLQAYGVIEAFGRPVKCFN